MGSLLLHFDPFPLCPYCGELPVFCDSAEVYGGKSFGRIYLCRQCQAWVGCHPGTTKPLGRLANTELRKAKRAAHAAFDPMWQRGAMTRTQAYRWLAEQLWIDVDDCHIGLFDIDQCVAVVQACAERKARLAAVLHVNSVRQSNAPALTHFGEKLVAAVAGGGT